MSGWHETEVWLVQIMSTKHDESFINFNKQFFIKEEDAISYVEKMNRHYPEMSRQAFKKNIICNVSSGLVYLLEDPILVRTSF